VNKSATYSIGAGGGALKTLNLAGTPGTPTNPLITSFVGSCILGFFGGTPGPRKVYSYAGNGTYRNTFSYFSLGDPLKIERSIIPSYLAVQFNSHIIDNYFIPDDTTFSYVGSSP